MATRSGGPKSYRLASFQRSGDDRRQVQKPPEARPPAARRRAGERVVRESARRSGRSRRGLRAARGSGRRRCGCRSRTRGAGWARARCRADPGSANCAGSRLAAPMQSVTERAGGSATPPIVGRAVEIRLPSWFELSKRRNSSTADCDQRRARRAAAARSSGHSSSACSPLPIRFVVVSWPALSRKMQLCSSSASVSRSPSPLALDQSRQHVGLGIAGLARGARRPASRGRRDMSRTARLPALALAPASAPARARRGSRATSRAAARARRAARRAGCR